MGRWMARAGRELLGEADALVPVPLHWRRLWARRFNQSALLGQGHLAGNRHGGRRAALKRVKATAAAGRAVAGRARRKCAGRLPRASRPQGEIAGRRLVLVDDVLTSGATSDACARALLRAGAAQVDVLVFARVVDAVRTPI